MFLENMSFKEIAKQIEEEDKEILELIEQTNDEKADIIEKLNQQIDTLESFIVKYDEAITEYESVNQDGSEYSKLKEIEESRDKAIELRDNIKERSKSIHALNENNQLKKDYLVNSKKLENILKVALRIQSKGTDYIILGTMFLLSGIFTHLQLLSINEIIGFIEGINPAVKTYIIISISLILEGYIVYNRKAQSQEKFIEGNLEVNWRNVLTLPNLLEGIFLASIIFYLFGIEIIATLLGTYNGILLMLSINSLIIGELIYIIVRISKVFIKIYTKAIENPKDRLTILVTIAATIISLIALFN